MFIQKKEPVENDTDWQANDNLESKLNTTNEMSMPTGQGRNYM